ncbi:hypothetical protein N7G274_003757 [Stereocaulon virgatum]|uniref:LAGLIDADG homing endonuclease n=1 Tax=Stereocaulon virgatum TaxID=373712 RepID=A0ABR4AD75_9LECA
MGCSYLEKQCMSGLLGRTFKDIARADVGVGEWESGTDFLGLFHSNGNGEKNGKGDNTDFVRSTVKILCDRRWYAEMIRRTQFFDAHSSSYYFFPVPTLSPKRASSPVLIAGFTITLNHVILLPAKGQYKN